MILMVLVLESDQVGFAGNCRGGVLTRGQNKPAIVPPGISEFWWISCLNLGSRNRVYFF